MGGKIDVYLDVVSLYSYIAFTELIQTKKALEAHGVTIEFHPVLLGAINNASGNKPPWTVPAKGKYLQFDTKRASARVGKPEIKGPKDLLAVGLTVLPLRALYHIKTHHPEPVYLAALQYLFHCFWTPPNRKLTDPAVLAEVLAEVPGSGSGAAKLFNADEVRDIMQGATGQEAKDAVRDLTQVALDRGAFGAPWYWVTNEQGKEEPFFGSDRFHHMYAFLGVPFQDITILSPGGGVGKGAKL